MNYEESEISSKNEKNLLEQELRPGLFEFLLSWACLAERLSRGNQNHSKTVKSIFNRLSFTLRFRFHNLRLKYFSLLYCEN